MLTILPIHPIFPSYINLISQAIGTHVFAKKMPIYVYLNLVYAIILINV
jgi:hypothetical protein